jgi:hypothetical protein
LNERNSEDRSSNAKAKKKQNGDRSRLPLKKRKGKWKVIEDQEWSEIEKLLNAKLNVDVRNGIEIAGDMFAYGGLTYTVENSVLTSDTLAQIDSWRAASNKLRRQLQLKPLGSTVKLSRRSIIRRGKKKQAFKRLKHATSLEFLGVFLQRAIEAAELVSLELHGETRNGPIERDLWSAWVTLTARHLRSQNISVTAASLNKTTKLSPFVELIDRLQMHLPTEIQRDHTEEGLTKRVQEALKTMGRLDEKTLLMILAGWGMGIFRRGYPGNVGKMSSTDLEAFVNAVDCVLLSLADRTAATCRDNKPEKI